jgi:cardiolipin synthase
MLVASKRVTGLVVLPALVILCREILVSGLREYLAEIRVPMPVSRLAKWKTALQMVALGILIVGEAGPPEIPLRLIGEVGLWIAAGLTMITGYDYLVRGLQHMRGDAAKPAEKKA